MSDLPVLTSPLLELPGVRHAFFTRQGGASEGIYAGLNVGLTCVWLWVAGQIAREHRKKTV